MSVLLSMEFQKSFPWTNQGQIMLIAVFLVIKIEVEKEYEEITFGFNFLSFHSNCPLFSVQWETCFYFWKNSDSAKKWSKFFRKRVLLSMKILKNRSSIVYLSMSENHMIWLSIVLEFWRLNFKDMSFCPWAKNPTYGYPFLPYAQITSNQRHNHVKTVKTLSRSAIRPTIKQVHNVFMVHVF